MCTKEYIYCDVCMYVYKHIHLPIVYVTKAYTYLWCMCTNAYTIHAPYIKTLNKEEGVG